MAAITVRRNVFLLPIKPLLSLQGLYHKFIEVGDSKRRLLSEDDYLMFKPGEINVSKWKKFDSRSLGITRTISASPYAVLQILRTRGFEAYLVGGCVRDLLLKRTPKDFDVITTAHLNQVSEQFHICEVVGQRFPVCRVFIKGSVVEVSSFDTLAKDTEGKDKFLISQMPNDCDKLDLLRWKNSMHRDFTINSLFFDPFVHTIYDYNDGMKDLLELKLRTLVPALLSFTEDPARILRGLRIAARLGLSLSKETKSAILKQTSSISRLGQFRTMMEMNYMLSYGAAEASISLLHKYHLLEILLPFQAAYISHQAITSNQSSMMLMKLLSHLDKIVACDRPSGSPLWIGLLAFHLALVNNPQHPFVILTFASVLYHQSWKEGLKFARKCGQPPINFEPETLDPYEFISDDEVANKVNQLAILVVDSVDVLMETNSMHHTIEKFLGSPSPQSGFVFVSKNMGHSAQHLFHVLTHKVETYNMGRSSFDINFKLLKKGYSLETRFALGKIILNTMGCGVDHEGGQNEVNNHVASSPKYEHFVNDKQDKIQPPLPSNLNLQHEIAPKKQKMITKLSSLMQDKSKGVSRKHMEVVGISSDSKNELQECATDKPKIGTSDSPMVESSIDDDESPNLPFLKKGYLLDTRLAILNTMGCRVDCEGGQNEVNRHVAASPKYENEKQDRKQPPLPFSFNLLQEIAPKKQNLITKLSSIMQDKSQGVSTKHMEVVGISSDSKNELQETNKPKIGTYDSPMVESSIDYDESASQLEIQNLEEGNTQVKVDELNQKGTRFVENGETGISSLLWSVQTNFNMAVEEVRASFPEMKKLNQFLVSFVEKQVERKKAKMIGSFQEKSLQLEPESNLASEAEEGTELESCSFVASSGVTSQTESGPEIRVEHFEETKTSQHKKITRVKSGMKEERKKQRVCSYCKEVGHNRTGCPKRKIEEASYQVDTEST